MKQPKGKLIAVFGPDGSGKSSIYNDLRIYSSRENINLCHYHWRPGLLPYTKKSSFIASSNDFTNPHSQKGRNTLKSILILFYIYFDFLLGYWLLIRPKLNQGISIYYERYFYDVLVDQVRYNLRTPLFIRRFLSKFVYEPNYIFVLSASAEIIFARKQELSIEEIVAQQKRLTEIFRNSHKVERLDVEKNDSKLIAKYMLKILKQCNG